MEKAKTSTPSSAKAAFAKLRNRPVSLPVSSFAFRFNPADEETLMELHDPSADDQSTKSSSKVSSKKSSRNLSLDDDTPDSRSDSCPESQTWSFLSDIRGKITKTMEEKFHIDLHSSSSSNSSPVTVVQQKKTIDKPDSDESAEDKSADKLTNTSTPDDVEIGEDGLRQLGSEVCKDKQELDANLLDVLESTVDDTTEKPVQKYESTWYLASAWDRKYWRISLAVFVCLTCASLPLPAYWSGFLFGCLFVAGFVFLWLHFIGLSNRIVVVERPSSFAQSKELRIPSSKGLEGVKKVWMNELFGVYLPDFHMNQTQSVFVRLDGSMLRLSYPKAKLPKRAMWNEQPFEETFIHQRHYDLQGADVQLLPEKLARRRHWIRKYPIFIRLAEETKVVDVAAPAHLVKAKDGSLTFFARTGREKEQWFRMLDAAAKSSNLNRSDSGASVDKGFQEYWVHVSRLISSPILEDLESLESSGQVTWLNALLGCSLWDFMRGKEGALLVKERMQKKLNMLKVPYFVEGLRITDLELGSELPQMLAISSPTLDERGLWIDFDMSYFGAFRMTLETKLNLLKFKKEAGLENGIDALSTEMDAQETVLSSRTAAYDSEAEDSGESSSDDDSVEQLLETSVEDVTSSPIATRGGAAASKKLLRFVDTIAQSRYFQHATEYKYVKRAMEGVSNTRLILSVEVLSLTGTLTLNIPPPPSDRLWYGFRGNPQLTVVAKPKVGELEVNLTNIVEWIESKLVLEFQRLLVLPNMDDLIIPFTNSGMKATSSSADLTPATPPWTKEK